MTRGHAENKRKYMEAGICEAVIAALNFHGQAFPDLCEKVNVLALHDKMIPRIAKSFVELCLHYLCSASVIIFGWYSIQFVRLTVRRALLSAT